MFIIRIRMLITYSLTYWNTMNKLKEILLDSNNWNNNILVTFETIGNDNYSKILLFKVYTYSIESNK